MLRKLLIALQRHKYLIHCGKGTRIARSVIIGPGQVSVGNYCFIGPECWILSKAVIGNYVMLAGRVAIVGGDHRIDVPGVPAINAGRDVNKQVIIEDDVWIGYGAIIMHGVKISEGSVVAAGAVVTKDIPPYSIYGGVPAREIRKRFSKEEETKHRESIKNMRNNFKD